MTFVFILCILVLIGDGISEKLRLDRLEKRVEDLEERKHR